MKKFLSSLLLVGLFTTYAVYRRVFMPDAIADVPVADPPPLAQQPISSPPTLVALAGQIYKDGTYTGTKENVYYGNVQVKVTVKKGKITDVAFLDYPKDAETSLSKSKRAMPILKQEAIKAQVAPVQSVSGASMTSGGFNKSFKAALAKAKKGA